MNRLALVAAAGSLILGFGCKHTQTTDSQAASAVDFPECPIIGRVILGPTVPGPSASFCEDRVVGPRVNLSRQADGSWAGWLVADTVKLTVSDGKLESPALQLSIEDTAEGTEIHGSWYTAFVDIRVSPSEVFIRTPQRRVPLWFRRAPDGTYGEGRFAQAVRLDGAAGDPHPPEPQFALAMIGAF